MKIGNLEVYGIIYKITNKINGKVYIGQTTQGFNLRYCVKGEGIERFYGRHKQLKDFGYKYNIHLINSIEKYGIHNFELNEYLDMAFSRQELNVKEVVWIRIYDSFKNGYNRNLGGDGNSGYEGLSGKDNPNAKSVIQLSLDGYFIKKWNTMEEASIDLKIRKSHISSTCNKRRRSTGGYIWIYSEEYDENKDYSYKKYDGYKKRSIIQLSLDGVFLNKYESIVEASKNNNIKSSGITKCCNGERKSYMNFIWVYEDDYANDKEYSYDARNLGKPKEIVQLSLEGNFIFEFKSISEAESILGFKNSHISSCCRGEMKSSNGYMWMFKSDYIENGVNKYKRDSCVKSVKMLDKLGNILIIFSSLKEAEEKTNISFKNISNCLRKKAKSAGGYIWEYN